MNLLTMSLPAGTQVGDVVIVPRGIVLANIGLGVGSRPLNGDELRLYEREERKSRNYWRYVRQYERRANRR